MDNNCNWNFRFFCSPNIPQSYGNALSYQEAVCRLASDISKIYDTVKNYTEFLEKVEEHTKHIDESIVEVTKSTINEMYSDGRLKTILDEVSREYFDTFKDYFDNKFNEFTEKTNRTISEFTENTNQKIEDFTKISRGMLPLSRIYRDINVCRFTKTTNDNEFHRFFLQGSTTFKKNNNWYFVGCYNVLYNSYLKTADNRIMIRVVNLSTGEVRESGRYMIGHSNGLTYNSDDDCFYILPSHYYDDSDRYVVSPYVWKISWDFSTYETSQTIPWGGTPYDITYKNGKLYVMINTTNFVSIRELKYDISDVETEICRIFKPQHLVYYNFDLSDDLSYVFLVDSEQKKLATYSIENPQSPVYFYNIPFFDNTHSFSVDEIESISVIQNEIYFMTSGYCGYISQTQQQLTQLFVGNFANNYIQDSNINQITFNQTAGNAIYVDYKNNNTNPTGSKSFPFKTINEAITFSQNQPYRYHMKIYVKEDNPLLVCATSNKVIDIFACDENWNYSSDRADNPNNSVVGGIVIQGCASINFNAFNFYNSTSDYSTDGTASTGHQKGLIYIIESKAGFFNCKTHTSEIGNFYPAPSNRLNQSVATYVEWHSIVLFNSGSDIGNWENSPTYSLLIVDADSNFVARTKAGVFDV